MLTYLIVLFITKISKNALFQVLMPLLYNFFSIFVATRKVKLPVRNDYIYDLSLQDAMMMTNTATS